MALRVHLEGGSASPKTIDRWARQFHDNASRTTRSNLDLQLLRKTRENSAPCFRDNHHVFQTRAAHAGIVQTRFDSEHLPILQDNFLQARMLMDFQAEAVAGSVEKSDAPAVAHSGRETATGEEFLDGLVNRHAVNAGLDSL